MRVRGAKAIAIGYCFLLASCSSDGEDSPISAQEPGFSEAVSTSESSDTVVGGPAFGDPVSPVFTQVGQTGSVVATRWMAAPFDADVPEGDVGSLGIEAETVDDPGPVQRAIWDGTPLPDLPSTIGWFESQNGWLVLFIPEPDLDLDVCVTLTVYRGVVFPLDTSGGIPDNDLLNDEYELGSLDCDPPGLHDQAPSLIRRPQVHVGDAGVVILFDEVEVESLSRHDAQWYADFWRPNIYAGGEIEHFGVWHLLGVNRTCWLDPVDSCNVLNPIPTLPVVDPLLLVESR